MYKDATVQWQIQHRENTSVLLRTPTYMMAMLSRTEWVLAGGSCKVLHLSVCLPALP
jgi:hypothetical protein